MTVTTQNPLKAPEFEIPDPPEEFGQDGGKFYRCYDALADEIDDDMVQGLKEQLDGMLIFAGLFAGVNTAFLALTLPLLSADPTDDITTLLAQNNAILSQFVTGRNDSVPVDSALPSADFSPPRNIFVINSLFALSLAFAIISSFLAVLGRQWLVYYRKRSGGGPDRQRWEQLRRFLGAERWRLQLILDDVLPSLLQIGLVIFCVSLLLYLSHLSSGIAVIVGIPLYLGLAFFIGSAVCTMWDKFCPFHSPLSHMLFWSVWAVPSALKAMQELKWRDLISRSSFQHWIACLRRGREGESEETLQVIALQRVICTSDEPVTLLNATANILGLTSIAQMEQLWSSTAFRERFLKQFETSYSRIRQLQGLDKSHLAEAAQRLYCAATAHMVLYLNVDWDECYGVKQAVWTVRDTMVLIPCPQIPHAPTSFLRANLAFALLQFTTYTPSKETVNRFLGNVATYSDSKNRSDWRLLSVLSFIVSHHLDLRKSGWSVDDLRRAYRCHVEGTVQNMGKAFEVLSMPESRTVLGCDRMLTNMVQCLSNIFAVDHNQSGISIRHKFTLLKSCELVLRSPERPEMTLQMIRQTRYDLIRVWHREYMDWVSKGWNTGDLLDILEDYFSKLDDLSQARHSYHEDAEALRALKPPIYCLFVDNEFADNWPGVRYRRESFRERFNELVSIVDKRSREIQNDVRRVRDPDQRWCHCQENPFSAERTYSIKLVSPESGWDAYVEDHGSSHSSSEKPK